MAGAVISDWLAALKYWEIIADNRSKRRRTAGLGLSRGSTKRPDFATSTEPAIWLALPDPRVYD